MPQQRIDEAASERAGTAGDQNGFVVELAQRGADMLAEGLDPALAGGRAGRSGLRQQHFGSALARSGLLF